MSKRRERYWREMELWRDVCDRTDAEVLAEIGVEAIARWLVDQGYIVTHRVLAESPESYKGRFAKNPGGGDFKGVKKER